MKIIKWLILALLVLAVVLSGFVYVKKRSRALRKKEKLSAQETVVEKPFVVVIPSYNNAAYCERNLLSVLTQNYTNYRVIYIDDNSKDQTLTTVQEVLARVDTQKRVRLIHNPVNQGSLANYYFAIHSCQDDEIVVTVDGDDFLAHENVLSRLNKVYADPTTWMTYGNFLDYPSYKQDPVSCKKLPASVVRNNTIRKHEWVTSHLRTFYAGLFKQIKLQDLLFEGKFFPMAGDLAYVMPLIEMAGSHVRYIPDVLYLYNRSNPISDHKINFALQNRCADAIRQAHPYPPLKEKQTPHPAPEELEKADVVVFSYDRPLQLYAFLESLFHFSTNYHRVSIIYRCSNREFQEAYEQVLLQFPAAYFYKQAEPQDFAPLVHKLVFDSEAPYVTFAVDDLIVKDSIDFAACIQALKKTGAYGFYLTHGTHLTHCYMQNCEQPLPPSINLGQDTLSAWQFETGYADWKYPNSVDLVVYRKEEIRKDLEKITFHHPTSLESNWALRAKNKRIGLFYAKSRAVNIPVNLVNPSTNRHLNTYSTAELLEKFKAGLKIDITPLSHMQNPSKHMAWDLTFVPRETKKH